MGLREQLREELAEAMRSRDAQRRDVIRMLLAAVKQADVDEGKPLSEAEVQAVLVKQAKQRRESIADAETAGRGALAEAEKEELAIIEDYLPQMMGREEIRALAAQVIADLGVTDMSGMGQVMGRLMTQLRGQADGQVVSGVVRDLLRQ